MKVLLLAPSPANRNSITTTQYPPLGILYIGGAIKDLVTELLILDANILTLDIKGTVERIIRFDPDIVGISINVVTACVSRQIACELRSHDPNIFLVAGGPLPTTQPDHWLQVCDVVVIGEGEEAFKNVVIQWKEKNKKVEGGFPGVYVKGGTLTHAAHPVLEELSFPAYDYLEPPLPYYSRKARLIKKNMASILTSRGCPYSCIFCDKSVHGTNFRPRSVESVLNEIKWLHDKFDVRQLDILDDNFTFDIVRAHKILDGIMKIDKFAINCQNGIRADRVTEELVDKMKKAGVFRVGIGIESGNQEIVNRINKHLSLQEVSRSVSLFRRRNITVHGYFIIGFPFETEEDILTTISFAISVNPHFANFSHFMPVIGTPIYKELEETNGLTAFEEEHTEGFYRLNPQITNSAISAENMKVLYSKVWRRFYLRPLKLLDIMLCIKSYSDMKWIVKVGIGVIKNNLMKKQSNHSKSYIGRKM